MGNSTEWGGRRVGSGQKPTKRVIQGGQDGYDPGVSAIPPENLPVEQREFWHLYAPLVIEKRTLTSHTEAAFRLLCALFADWRGIEATIAADGRTYVKAWTDSSGQEHEELKAHPLTSAYGQRAKAVETLMARFGLAPFGKAELPMAKKVAANPWASVAQK